MDYAESETHRMPPTSPTFTALPGNGLTAKLDGSGAACGGNASFIATKAAACPRTLQNEADALAEQGKTPLFFGRDGRLHGRHRRG